ncbi:symmetrical bis(5'-nucleosyl)-tetraphosphatase [Imbroritus primus]|uniref:symmetrical bis(5'-nucleosyl)-tetraphosphatase n=1 Tax=Imbroritus primus TaxID=3058603 RepID=UPI003D160546
MLPYAIGDLQGCHASLLRLLDRLPANAPLWFAGDLVNRGPGSAATLRAVRSMGKRARTVLGNHDIHLLAVAAGVRKPGRQDTLDELLHAPDAEELITWLRHQPLAIADHGFLMVHAGVLPQWTTSQVLALAAEVEAQLRGPDWEGFLGRIFGPGGERWQDDLVGTERHRVIVNALTRIRFCTADGVMDLKTKEGAGGAPPGHLPWFDVPGRQTRDTVLVTGHWSTLGLVLRDNLVALDTGCVWGGCLSAVRLHLDPAQRTVEQVKCPQMQDPLG